MKVSFGSVMRDVQLTTLALAIGFGLALIQLAEGVAFFIEGLAEHGRNARDVLGFPGLPVEGNSLSWVFGGHLFSFGQLVTGLIMLGVVWVVAVLVRRRPEPDVPSAEPA
ncbi:MAG TPA: hypothetical protein VKB43_02620 [Gaiellaceae bacterium]|nr:hypothetical protein [Gaiellaceae bacterium]